MKVIPPGLSLNVCFLTDCIYLSIFLRPNSHWPPWPRMCPSATLWPCPQKRLSTATTKSGWCRPTFPWLLPSDRVSRPSTSTRGIPRTDKVGRHDTLVPYMDRLTPGGSRPLHAHVNLLHTHPLLPSAQYDHVVGHWWLLRLWHFMRFM